MNIVLKKQKDCITSLWSGGKTTELAIYPENSKYVEQNFIWRLSSATVEVEESDFTPLANYNRVLIVLEGTVKLVHKNIREIILSQYEQDCFKGSYNTKSYGKIRDFNLMTYKGNEGSAEVINLEDIDNNTLEITNTSKYSMKSESFYCLEDSCFIELNGKSEKLEAGEILIATGKTSEFKSLKVKGIGKAVRAWIDFEI